MTMRPTRFAHLEGHTDIVYSDDGRHIITGGLDGDLRIFKDLDDDDCVSHTVAEQIHCIAYKNGSILTGTNLNLIQCYTLDEGQPNGLITRFTAFPTHISLSEDKNYIAVASSDMTIKVHEAENFRDLTFTGHQAPVLSVAIDPQRDYLASSSCDGTVRLWNYRTQTMVRSFPLIPKSNDFAFSSTLCRLCWSKDGQYLFVPVSKEVQVFNRNTWKVEFKLSHSSIVGDASVSQLSPCGKYIAVGCCDGRIAVWNCASHSCIASEKSRKGMAITGLAWHPKGKEEIAFVNNAGEFGTMVDFMNSLQEAKDKPTEIPKQAQTSREFGAEVNDEAGNSVFPPEDVADDDDDSEISIAKIKSQLGFADDEEGTFLGLPKPDAGDDMSRPSSRVDAPLPAPTLVAPKFPEPQKPFQPGMSPEHLNDRYMVWNNTGIVRQYRSEEEHSIEIEFHDSSIHHALHLNNHLGHSMAALNNEALVLAAESQDDEQSKLVVHHFSAWDGSKEWQTEMREGEDILALGIGLGWVAAATDLRYLRVFTTAGVQQNVITIPGPVVCLSGFDKKIMIVYHNGIGINGEQSLSVMVLNINGRKHPLATPVPLAMSPKSYLAWAGFTDEGTPLTVDSVGIVRILNYKMGPAWMPVLHTKDHAKGKSDHYFILGASEIQGVIRCVLCRGSRYPPVLPRPHVSLLNFKIPLCEIENEKSILEEKVIKTKLVCNTIESLAKDGFDMESPQSEANKLLKETMVKLFALACKADRESRGVEVCELMPSADMVEVAVRYAAKLHRMQLAERLNEVVQRKIEENNQDDSEEEEEKRYNSYGKQRRSGKHEDLYGDEDEVESAAGADSGKEEAMEDLMKRNPLLAAAHKQNSNKDNPFDRFNLTPNTRNPFRKTAASSGVAKGMQVLDTLKVAKKENFGPPVLKPVLKQPKPRQKSLSFVKDKDKAKDAGSKEKDTDKENKADNSIESSAPVGNSPAIEPPRVAKKTSALKLWLEDNKDAVKEKYPDATETDLLLKAALLFKDVEDAVKQKYKLLAAEQSQPVKEKPTGAEEEKKRKQESTENEQQPMEKKTKLSAGSKLAGFAFSKKTS